MLKSSSVPLKGNERYEGYCADLAKQLALHCDIDYHIVHVVDNRYGAQKDDGTWDGVVGELVAGVRGGGGGAGGGVGVGGSGVGGGGGGEWGEGAGAVVTQW